MSGAEERVSLIPRIYILFPETIATVNLWDIKLVS